MRLAILDATAILAMPALSIIVAMIFLWRVGSFKK